MSKRYLNGLRAELNASGLTDVATTITFAAAPTYNNGDNVPTLAPGEFIPLTILNTDGHLAEIVWLVGYTTAGTTGTILRGRDGTDAVAHDPDVTVISAATAGDFPGTGHPERADGRLGAALTKVGVVLEAGSGTWDGDYVESPTILRDPLSGRYAMVHVGYGTTTGAIRAQVGLAWSDDLVSWTKETDPLLSHSGVAASPDQNGCTGPLLLWDRVNEQYVLYYIGLTATGYEGGTKSICYATATSLSGSWTRHGAVISPAGTGWREDAIWHPSIVERNGTWYLFFNAHGDSAIENIGYATAPSITGPWTVDDVNSPILSVVAATWESEKVGDPCVRRVGDLWVMDYFGYDGDTAGDGFAVTSDANFPLGWVRHPDNPILEAGPEIYDEKLAHKPFVVVDGGEIYHFYTAVADDDTRTVALAVTTPVFTGDGGSEPPGGTPGIGGKVWAKRTAGNVTINSATFTNVDTALDLVVPAVAGDVVDVGLMSRKASGSSYIVFDFHTIIAGSPVNSVSADTTAGTTLANSLPMWGYPSGTSVIGLVGRKLYQVQAGDIDGSGNVTFRLRCLSGGSVVIAAADPVLYVDAINYGP